jgi:hypothetical protein
VETVKLWIWVAAVAVLPLLVTMLVVHLLAVFDLAESLRERLRERLLPRRARGQQADVQPVERLAADLHRLAIHLDKVERSDDMHRVARLRAAALAYDDVLRSACRTLEVEMPESIPFDSVERLQTEAALAQRGLIW